MGIGNLGELAKCADETIATAARALWAELADGSWKTDADLAEHYPTATIDGAQVRIPLGPGHHVDLLVNYHAEMMLIEYAGVADSAQPRRATKGKAA
ncbi:hypothetical protein [Rhizobium mesosinicum]|nr:hypothetical protein [Rhizobium mesosinicum]